MPRRTHSRRAAAYYVAFMAASSAMGKHLARAAAEAREQAGRKHYHIAAAAHGDGTNPSTVYRFEKGDGWPRNADHMVDLYAADLDLDPIQIWTRALQLWREEESDGEPAEPSDGPVLPTGGLEGFVEEVEDEWEPARDDDQRDEEHGQSGA